MTGRRNLLNRVEIVSPCSNQWSLMTGDDRIRFCDQCNKQVYNISKMTREQAETLLANSQGRLCAKIERLDDGTIVTEDSYEIRRPIRLRASKAASVVITALLGLNMNAVARASSVSDKPASVYAHPSDNKAQAQAQSQEGRALIFGTVLDESKAAIVDAQITILDEKTDRTHTLISSQEGTYRFPKLEPGTYTLQVAAEGFNLFRKKQITLNPNQELRIDVTLKVGTTGGIAIIQEPSVGERLIDIPMRFYKGLKKIIGLT